MLTVNVMINVMLIGQPAETAIFRWRARLAYEKYVYGNGPYIGNYPPVFKFLHFVTFHMWVSDRVRTLVSDYTF